MKDLIDKRNFIEKSQRSIVKGYNAHFVSEEEMEKKRQEENAKAARETYIRLRKEEERKKEKEKEELRQAYERKMKQRQVLEDETDIHVTEEQIDQILGEAASGEDDIFMQSTAEEPVMQEEDASLEENITIEENITL